MTYFQKNETAQWLPITPSLVLPLIYKDSLELKSAKTGSKSWIDQGGTILTNEVPLTLYLASWTLSNFIITDLIEDKLGYEKDSLKSIDYLSSDLGADSLDLVEIILYLEKTAGIFVHEGLHFKCVADLVDYVFSIMVIRIQKIILSWSTDDINVLIDW